MSGSIEPIVPGQVIFDIGQQIDKCFILQKGSVHFFNSKEEKISGIAPNTMFGFTELVKGKTTHSTKAVCITPGTVVTSVPGTGLVPAESVIIVGGNDTRI